jgi:putative sigma-54 modulation protein
VELIVKGRHTEVRPDIRAYAEEKVGKVTKVLNDMVMNVEVELYHERNRSIDKHEVAEVTVYTKGPVIRAREASSDMKAAIDLATAKLERQARRFKEKVMDRHVGRPLAAVTPELEPEEPAEGPAVVKTKAVDLKPMTEEEATLQLELLGHDFLLFSSVETGDVNVLYRRRDGDYGLLQARV